MARNRKHMGNRPLTPSSLPVPRGSPETVNQPSEAARSLACPLNFVPASGIERFLGVPAILIFCILTGYLIGRWRFSLVILIPVVHVFYYLFKRRITEYKRSIEVLSTERNRAETLGEFETVEWVNHIIKKYWDVSEQTISSIIFNEVNNVLRDVLPGQSFSLKLSEITLGTRPPVVEKIAFVENAESKLILECAANFIPVQADEEILTYFKKERAHWNTYIEIQVIFGNLISIPILVKDFMFSGVFKIELQLTQKIPFTSKFSFSFLELPAIDFKLIPLKSVDMLDLPYIGGLLNTVIDSQIKKTVLTPKAIEIDLLKMIKYSGKIVGVVYVFVHDLESPDESTFWAVLDCYGKPFGKTEKKSGRDPVFNQGFYTIVSDTTKSIQITLQSTEQRPLHGKIALRNLNTHVFSERMHLSSEGAISFLSVTTQFYPISKEVRNSAIVLLNLVSIEDLQCVGELINKLYTTYCIITLEVKNSISSNSVLKRMQSKTIFTTKDPFYNETFRFFVRGFDNYIVKIQVVDEKSGKKIGNVVIACTDIKDGECLKYRISGVEGGEMNLQFSLKYVDMADEPVDEIYLYSQRCQPIDEEGVDSGAKDEQKVPGAYIECAEDKTKADITGLLAKDTEFGIYNVKMPNLCFIEYKMAVKFTVEKIMATGAFYIVFETEHITVSMEPFTTEMAIDRSVVVPIRNEKTIRMRLFRIAIAGDVMISEEVVGIRDTVVVFDKIRVDFTVDFSDFSDFSSVVDDDSVKIVQVAIGEMNSDVQLTANYSSSELAQNVKLIHRVSTFILGSEKLECSLLENGKEVATAVIPKRNCEEEFEFSGALHGRLYCRAQVCGFQKKPVSRCGELEVFLIKGNKVGSKTGEVYVKVFLNSEKIFKTMKRAKAEDPVFNESFRIKVNKNIDRLGLHVYSATSLSMDKLVYFADFSLFNISEGYFRTVVNLRDGTSGEESGSNLQLIFNYKGEDKDSRNADLY